MNWMSKADRETGGWWYRASTEQRLAQIDGGIELEMTVRQVALASGAHMTHGGTVQAVAREHGRRFPHRPGRSARTGSAAKKRGTLAAFMRGEPVNFWSEQPRQGQASDEIAEVTFE